LLLVRRCNSISAMVIKGHGDVNKVLGQYNRIGLDFDDVLYMGPYDRAFLKFVIDNPDKTFVLMELASNFIIRCNRAVDIFKAFKAIVTSPDEHLCGHDAVHQFKATIAKQYELEVMVDDDKIHMEGFEDTSIDFIHVELPKKRPTMYGGWF